MVLRAQMMPLDEKKKYYPTSMGPFLMELIAAKVLK